MKELLSIQRLSVSFEENNFAVRDISFSLQDGEFVVLLGSSGAGKSTLLRSLNGLVQPCSGSIRSRHHGEISASTNRQLRAHRRDTAMVFQQHQLIDRLSVLDNVLMGRLGYHSLLRSLLPLPENDRQKALRTGGLGMYVCEEGCSEGPTKAGPSDQNLKVVWIRPPRTPRDL